MSIKKVIDCIRKNNVFLITAHKNLEGDALGSEIAFACLLRKLGKTAIIVNQDSAPQEYRFLKGFKSVIKYRHNMKIKFDVLVMLDCTNKSRCGYVLNLARLNQPIINIDHHISNTKFGNINWVLPDASSAAELVYQLYKAMDVKIDADSARAIYTGILTDTGSFRHLNTTSLTHQIAAELLKFKLSAAKIYQNIYESVSFSDISLLSKILLSLKRHASGKIITAELKRGALKGRSVHFDLTENILNFARLIRGGEVCILFREQGDNPRQTRVNFRSRGKIDVNRIAQSFGGGGHKTASGCVIKGSLEKARRQVIQKIKEYL
ncbi:MAG: bifunctional oligoribonuclease/PAP phosphatase NrnA [Candidatus Omnitrophota bacterium]